MKDSLARLRKAGLIEVGYFRFNGNKTSHIRPLIPKLMRELALAIIAKRKAEDF